MTARPLLVAIAALSVTSAWASSEPLEASPEALVRECRSESRSGHLRAVSTFRAQIDGHKMRMAAICSQWASIADEERDSLLDRCLREARRGLMRRYHGVDFDRPHVLRLSGLCRRLHALR